MGYYIRVLGTKDVSVPLKDIDDAVVAKEVPLNLSSAGRSDLWAGLTLNGLDGTAICGPQEVSRRESPTGLPASAGSIFTSEAINPEKNNLIQ